MADTTYDIVATVNRNQTTVLGKGDAGNLKKMTATVELPASAAIGYVAKLARLPSNARLHSGCELYWDALATTSPDLDIGVHSVDSNITSDDDAINDGLDGGAAGAAVKMIKTIDDIGDQLWTHVNGQTSDPGGELDIVVTVTVTALVAGGTFVADIEYTLD